MDTLEPSAEPEGFIGTVRCAGGLTGYCSGCCRYSRGTHGVLTGYSRGTLGVLGAFARTWLVWPANICRNVPLVSHCITVKSFEHEYTIPCGHRQASSARAKWEMA